MSNHLDVTGTDKIVSTKIGFYKSTKDDKSGCKCFYTDALWQHIIISPKYTKTYTVLSSSNYPFPISACQEKVSELEQNLKDLNDDLESSKAREGSLRKDVIGLYITQIIYKQKIMYLLTYLNRPCAFPPVPETWSSSGHSIFVVWNEGTIFKNLKKPICHLQRDVHAIN